MKVASKTNFIKVLYRVIVSAKDDGLVLSSQVKISDFLQDHGNKKYILFRPTKSWFLFKISKS